MKFKTYTGITWSLLELTGLLEDDESRVYFEKYKKHFGLHPFHLTNLNTSLNEILSSNLNSYDAELKGFLLAYQNPKLLTPLGEIFYDTCFIHIDVEAEFYVFRPEVGSSIKGIVNKKGVDHIGVLVHKAFNVSIPKPDDDENWLGNNLEIDQEVKFVVTLLDLNSKLPFIRGTLDPDNYLEGCKLIEKTFSPKTQHENVKNNVKIVHSVKQKKQHTFFDSENSSDEDTVQVKKETPKRSRRKSFEQEEVIEYNEDKTNIKKVKESKSKKKSRDYSSQSSIDEHVDVRTEKSPKKLPRRLSSVEPEDEFRKIKVEIAENINRKQIKQEIVSESGSKSKKSSAKRKNLDETDNSAEDFTADKYIRNSSKKTSRKHKVLDTDTNGVLSNVKVEQCNNRSLNDSLEVVEESPSKKKHKKQKNAKNIKEEDSAEISYEENEDNASKKTRKKHTKKVLLDISEIKVEPTFENVVIKIEKPDDTGSYNETTEKQVDHDVHTNRSKKRDSVNKELKVHKAKIKKEKSVSNTISDEDQQELKAHKVNVKMEKSVAYSISDEDQEVVKVDQVKMKKEMFVTNIVSDEDQSDTHDQYIQKTKKHSKNSPRKQSSESEVDHSRVKVKIEKCTDG
ncbi:RNA polymerase I subunit F [Halictus rubicundus]|uniref:RNA polymerase I subunit F n=1 Tax=Halictus rubicundus TaxID=77578 RepID=UPI0040371F1E